MRGKKPKFREVLGCVVSVYWKASSQNYKVKTKLHQDLWLAMKGLSPAHQNQTKSMKQATRPILHFSKSHNLQAMHVFYVDSVSQHHLTMHSYDSINLLGNPFNSVSHRKKNQTFSGGGTHTKLI